MAIDLEDLGLRFPYIEHLRFEGRIRGRLLIDDIELVVSEVATVVEEEDRSAPAPFRLEQNSPNPFNTSTVIRFLLPKSDVVELTLYSLAGQKVATLIEGSVRAGVHELLWNGLDSHGRAMASGLYFYRLRSGSHVQVRKLLFVR